MNHPRVKRALAVGSAVLVASCQSVRSGRTSFEFLSPPPAPNVSPQAEATPSESDTRIVYIPPRAKKTLAQPVFPEAIGASMPDRTEVVATLTVNESGRVSDVRRSFRDLSVLSGDFESLVAAIVSATAVWEFEPARQVYWQKVAGEDDRYLYAEIVPARFDVRFVFVRSKK